MGSGRGSRCAQGAAGWLGFGVLDRALVARRELRAAVGHPVTRGCLSCAATLGHARRRRPEPPAGPQPGAIRGSIVSGGKLFGIIIAAVLAANLATLILMKLWMEYEAGRLVVQFQAETERFLSDQRAKLDAMQKEQAETAERQRAAAAAQARQAQTERDRAANAARIEWGTYASWRRFYEQEKTEYNRLMMERACN